MSAKQERAGRTPARFSFRKPGLAKIFIDPLALSHGIVAHRSQADFANGKTCVRRQWRSLCLRGADPTGESRRKIEMEDAHAGRGHLDRTP